MKKAKLFWKLGDQTRKIIAIPYDGKMEYYSFVKKCNDTDFRQIIVTSETMIQLIQKIVIARFRVSEIKLAENEAELNKQVGVLLDRIETNPACLTELASLLGFISEKPSIEIQRVGFMGWIEDGVSVEGFVQSNGVIGTNREVSDKVFETVGAVVEKCVFGC